MIEKLVVHKWKRSPLITYMSPAVCIAHLPLRPHGLSTADPMSCAASSLTGISPAIPGWVAALIRFLAEKSIAVRDDQPD